MDLFRVNCAISTLSKSKAVRGKYCIVLPGEGNEFELSTKDTLISRRVTMCLVGSFVVNNILKLLHVVKKKQRSSHILNATLILQDKCHTALLKTNFLHLLFFPGGYSYGTCTSTCI